MGGVLATAESGTLRIRYGAVRDLVLGVEIALPDGTLVKAGGKVVKNVAGYDLTRLMIGSLGTLGVITQTVFRLHPISVATATYSTSVFSTAEASKVVLAILDSHLVYTGLQIRAESASQIAIDARFEGIPESLLDQYEKLNRLAAGHAFTEASDNVWQARQELFADAGNATVCKFSVLPSQIGSLCDAVFRLAKSNEVRATLVAQATGLGELRLATERSDCMLAMIGSLRGELDRLDGTLTLQQCPVAIKQQFDVWQTSQDAIPLMQQIKGKFDPARTLNRGRFVGAI